MLNPIFELHTPAELGIKVIAFTVHGFCNELRSARLEQRLAELRSRFDLQHSIRQAEGFNDLKERIGRSPRRFRASPQALLDLYLRRGELNPISPVVDLYNRWSLNSGLSIGAHDLEQIELPVSLTMSRGGETFSALGSTGAVSLSAGEFIYLDDQQKVICRMDYRQCQDTALNTTSRDALFIVQGHRTTSEEYLRSTAQALKTDILRCCSEQYHHVA